MREKKSAPCMEFSFALEDLIGTIGKIWKRSVGYLIVVSVLITWL